MFFEKVKAFESALQDEFIPFHLVDRIINGLAWPTGIVSHNLAVDHIERPLMPVIGFEVAIEIGTHSSRERISRHFFLNAMAMNYANTTAFSLDHRP